MKRRITLLVILVLSIVTLSLMTSEATVNAQSSHCYVGDSGMVTLGSDQALRITVTPPAGRRPTSLTLTFNAQVTTVTCNGGVCTHTVISETTADPVTLMPGQAASYDITQPSGASAVRGRVFGDNPDMLVNGLMIDTTTGMTRGTFNFRITASGYGVCAG